MSSEVNLDTEMFEEGGRRNYFRVISRIPLRCRLVEGLERDVLAEEVVRPRIEDEIHVDEALAHWLRRIEGKLDHILVVLKPDAEPPLREVASQEIVLSGAGVRFRMERCMDAGSEVELSFLLPGPLLDPVRCLGRVVKVAPAEGEPEKFEVAVAFTIINEVDRGLVLAHVMDVQRSELRQRAENGPAA